MLQAPSKPVTSQTLLHPPSAPSPSSRLPPPTPKLSSHNALVPINPHLRLRRAVSRRGCWCERVGGGIRGSSRNTTCVHCLPASQGLSTLGGGTVTICSQS